MDFCQQKSFYSLLFNMLYRFVIAFLLRSKLQKSLWAVTAAMKLRCLLLHFTSVAQFYPTLCDPMDCSTPGFPVHHQLPEFTQTQRPSSQWFHPTISSSVIPFSHFQSFPASGSFPMSQFFESGGQSYWSFSFSISHSNEYSGLISFRMDWSDLLAVQGTLNSLVQHYSSKASIFQGSAFFIVQL